MIWLFIQSTQLVSPRVGRQFTGSQCDIRFSTVEIAISFCVPYAWQVAMNERMGGYAMHWQSHIPLLASATLKFLTCKRQCVGAAGCYCWRRRL